MGTWVSDHAHGAANPHRRSMATTQDARIVSRLSWARACKWLQSGTVRSLLRLHAWRGSDQIPQARNINKRTDLQAPLALLVLLCLLSTWGVYTPSWRNARAASVPTPRHGTNSACSVRCHRRRQEDRDSTSTACPP